MTTKSLKSGGPKEKMQVPPASTSPVVTEKPLYEFTNGRWSRRKIQPLPPIRTALSFITFNCWFSPQFHALRAKALLYCIEQYKADFVCLQEVEDPLFAILCGSTFVQNTYCITHINAQEFGFRYGVVVLAQRDFGGFCMSHTLPSIFGRSLQRVITSVLVPSSSSSVSPPPPPYPYPLPPNTTTSNPYMYSLNNNNNNTNISHPYIPLSPPSPSPSPQYEVRNITVASVHLESLQHTERRLQQLATIFSFFEQFDAPRQAEIFFMGDFNFHDQWIEQRFLEERKHLARDVWPWLYPKDPGWTENGTVNKMNALRVSKKSKFVRFDRQIQVSLTSSFPWTPVHAELLGTTPIPDAPDGALVHISDHFGLYARYNFGRM